MENSEETIVILKDEPGSISCTRCGFVYLDIYSHHCMPNPVDSKIDLIEFELRSQPHQMSIPDAVDCIACEWTHMEDDKIDKLTAENQATREMLGRLLSLQPIEVIQYVLGRDIKVVRK